MRKRSRKERQRKRLNTLISRKWRKWKEVLGNKIHWRATFPGKVLWKRKKKRRRMHLFRLMAYSLNH